LPSCSMAASPSPQSSGVSSRSNDRMQSAWRRHIAYFERRRSLPRGEQKCRLLVLPM
jgi:hypothetical protein